MTWKLTYIDGRWRTVFAPQMDNALPLFLFDRQRTTCEACAHHVTDVSKQGDHELLCTVQGGHISCSCMRLPDYACGPQAACFSEGDSIGLKAARPPGMHVVVAWSEVDLELLRRNYADSATDDLAVACRKTAHAVSVKASELGLVKSKAFLSMTNRQRAAASRAAKAETAEPAAEAMPAGITRVTRHFLL